MYIFPTFDFTSLLYGILNYLFYFIFFLVFLFAVWSVFEWNQKSTIFYCCFIFCLWFEDGFVYCENYILWKNCEIMRLWVLFDCWRFFRWGMEITGLTLGFRYRGYVPFLMFSGACRNLVLSLLICLCRIPFLKFFMINVLGFFLSGQVS